MISHQNLVVVASVLFYLIAKIVSVVNIMYRSGVLSSIPEIDVEDDNVRKWVPKKKHEVLKAKYKCLKKLFQIYDASVIGILPNQDPSESVVDSGEQNRRRKRSHRTKTDACAGTNEITSGDNNSEMEAPSVATAVIRELTIDQSCISTQMDPKIDKFAETVEPLTSEKNLECNCHNNCQYTSQNCQSNCQYNSQNCQTYCQNRVLKENQMMQSLNLNQQIPFVGFERRKLTRFQCFVQRLFGIRKEAYRPDQMHTASDPILTFKEKRRRRGLRFRRIKRAKKVRSESALRELKSPSILSYVQSVQKHCLMDTTPRKCPIMGCNMLFYGIINYNDHLNLCHFKDRKYYCHYCHEGFETEYDKLLHENEHIGFSKLGANMSFLSSVGQTHKIASITQTEPDNKIPEEKLKKIVSFFDKFSDPEQMLTEIKKSQSAEINMTGATDTGSCASSTDRSESVQTRATSCYDVRSKTDKLSSSDRSDSSRRIASLGHICRFCGESFTCRRQLTLHIESEHRATDRITKYHSCAGIISARDGSSTVQRDRDSTTTVQRDRGSSCQSARASSLDIKNRSEESLSCDPDANIEPRLCWCSDGTVTVQSDGRESSCQSDRTSTLNSKGRSEMSISCDPSTNIVYYTSVESLDKPSTASLAGKTRYRWEPGTKIIRV